MVKRRVPVINKKMTRTRTTSIKNVVKENSKVVIGNFLTVLCRSGYDAEAALFQPHTYTYINIQRHVSGSSPVQDRYQPFT